MQTRAGTLAVVKKDRVDVSSTGLRLKSTGSHTAVTLDGEAVHIMSPHHPSRDANRHAMLSSAQAGAVLNECAPPADEDVITAATAYSSLGDPFAHVVWFKPSVGDAVHNVPNGSTAQLVKELRQWAAEQESDSNTTSTQEASGIYVTLGNGILPGRSRVAIDIEDRSTNVPFSRANPRRSDEIEPVLAQFHGIVTDCLTAAYPEMSSWTVSEEADAWVRTCQYPRPPRGARTIPAQQVVIRGHLRSDPPNISAADLHRDKMDGGFEFGGCIIFAGGNESREAQWRRFAIFEERNGGRGVSIPVLHDDYICALCCPYQEHLHGTVIEPETCETSEHAPSSTGEEMEGLHVVAYNLKMMETFVDRISRASSSMQGQVRSLLDDRLQRIATEAEAVTTADKACLDKMGFVVHWSTTEPRYRLGTEEMVGTEARCLYRGSVLAPSFAPSLDTEARCCGLPRLGESAAHRASVPRLGTKLGREHLPK